MRKTWHRYFYLKAFERLCCLQTCRILQRGQRRGFYSFFDTALLSNCTLLPGTENRAQASHVLNEFPIKQMSYLLAPSLDEFKYSEEKSGTALTGEIAYVPSPCCWVGVQPCCYLDQDGSKCNSPSFPMSIYSAHDMHSGARLPQFILWEIFSFCTLLKHAVNQEEKWWWPRLKSLLAIHQVSGWIWTWFSHILCAKSRANGK